MFLPKDSPSDSKIEIASIDYPVRIHWTYNCTCKRILTKLTEETIDNYNEISCVLEKIWTNTKFPNRFCGFMCIKENRNNAIKLSSLNSLFDSSMESRRNMINYFKNYQWLPCQSVVIRHITQTINSVCLCRDNLIIDKTTSNAGFVIIGNRNQMEKISHCFNKYTKKTEFSTVCYIKLDSISNIKKKNMDHTLLKFTKSSVYDQLRKNSSLYTLVGLQSEWNSDDSDIDFSTPERRSLLDSAGSPSSTPERRSLSDSANSVDESKTVYGFPFGKREWCCDVIESSFDCAKRELYEEFNIQFSLSLWKYNETINMPKHIYTPGFILYVLYLSNNTLIGYHGQSDTIYLNKI